MAADDGTNRGAARPGSGPAVWLFWSAVWLALVFVGAKLAYLAARRDPGTADSGADLLSLAAITYRDVVFVIGAWAIARAAVAALRFSRIASGAVAVLFAAFAAIVSLYAIASVIAFGILGGFLTYSLLQLIGSVRMIESSAHRRGSAASRQRSRSRGSSSASGRSSPSGRRTTTGASRTTRRGFSDRRGFRR
ncbi:MAG: hypothetical protein DMF93_22165 [Acidobacteria bacterium]|nr:MAG: hypothetical protein DMF93_22165 [Acidobacteriota bacterium]